MFTYVAKILFKWYNPRSIKPKGFKEMSSDNAVLGTATTGGAAAAAVATATNNDLALLIGLIVGLILLVALGLWVRHHSKRQ